MFKILLGKSFTTTPPLYKQFWGVGIGFANAKARVLALFCLLPVSLIMKNFCSSSGKFWTTTLPPLYTQNGFANAKGRISDLLFHLPVRLHALVYKKLTAILSESLAHWID